MAERRTILYVGNHQPGEPRPWSTETHVAASFELNGHAVIRTQEADGVWARVPAMAAAHNADLVLWTRTQSMDSDVTAQSRGLLELRDAGVPTAAMHLDKFWDLPRANLIRTEPWFRCDYVFTADGGNQERFANAGVNHHWLPPAVFEPECVLGTCRPEMVADIGFVGSWQGGYHPEWPHRDHLVGWLAKTYGDKVVFWPKAGEGQIRGQRLADLYASVRVLVGDSCMVGGTGRYWSDRVPETLGRGGFLLHPYTEGLVTMDGQHEGNYWAGVHLDCWQLGDWQGLRHQIDFYLDHPEGREAVRLAGHGHVRDHHTYTNRTRQLLDVIGRDRGWTEIREESA